MLAEFRTFIVDRKRQAIALPGLNYSTLTGLLGQVLAASS